MKVLIVSDTHRKDDNLERIIEEEAPFDMLIHLGDAEGSEYLIEDWVDKDCQLEMVKGFFTSGPVWGTIKVKESAPAQRPAVRTGVFKRRPPDGWKRLYCRCQAGRAEFFH